MHIATAVRNITDKDNNAK